MAFFWLLIHDRAFLSGKNASHAENIQPHKTDSLADIFDQTIDPAYFDTTWISNFREPNPTGTFMEEQGHFASFCQGSQHRTFSEELSSESENGGAGTSDQPLEGTLECESPEHSSSPAHNIYFGFTVGSGWSGTFFPDGDDEKPWNVHDWWDYERSLIQIDEGAFFGSWIHPRLFTKSFAVATFKCITCFTLFCHLSCYCTVTSYVKYICALNWELLQEPA